MTTLQTVLGCVYASACIFFFLSSAAEISYSDHCSDKVPESIPTTRVTYPDATYTLSDLTSHYYFWGGRVIRDHLSNLSDHRRQDLKYSDIHVTFRPSRRNLFRTASPGVYKLEANLVFRYEPNYEFRNYSDPVSGNYSSRRASLRFGLQGFWSEGSKRLCMVGKSKSSHNFSPVFHLTFGEDKNSNSNSTIFTSFARGILDTVSSFESPNFFDPVKIVSFPYIKDYNFTLNFSERNDLDNDIPPKQSLSLKEDSICSTFQYHTYEFDLEYALGCTSPNSEGCSPIKGQPAPNHLSLSAFQCSEDQEKLRYLVSFSDREYTQFGMVNPYQAFVGEGTWDSEMNRLNVVACTIENPIEESADVSVGECSFRLSLSFPVVWTIKNTSSIVGLAWSNKTETEFGHFKDIRLSRSSSRYRSMDNGAGFMPGLRYEYTQTDKVRELCPRSQGKKSGDHLRYPKAKEVNSYEMGFSMSAKHGKESVGRGEGFPIAVENKIYGGNSGVFFGEYGDEEEESISHGGGQMNVSYKLTFSAMKYKDKFFYVNSSVNYEMSVYAEGVYDSESGHLCMVGCREMYRFNTSEKLLDCELVMEFQFPAMDSKVGSSINGYISSRRKKDDDLYFNPLNISGNTYYSVYSERTIERMDVEVILVLISNTLLCLFIASQILYVKKHSEALHSISLVMVVILTLGHMIPLVLNLESFLLKSEDHDHRQQEGFLREGSKIELSEVSVRLSSLVVFLLLLRLLQVKWSARTENVSEKKPAFVSFVLYGVGGVFTVLVQMQWSFSFNSLKFLKSYGGLVLDGFLLPQIVLNLFQNPAHKKSLSCWFYMGLTMVRLFPHGYDFYREQNFVQRGGFKSTSSTSDYIYANPGVDFYSIAWDVAIPCGCVVFAATVWLQQRYGGRCFLPPRIRQLGSYEKLPTAIVG